MRVFVLEDDPARLIWFFQRFQHDELTCCVAADEAIKAFDGHEWDLVCLDHDLGGEVFVDSSREDTGAGFVRACAEQLSRCPALIVHSMNPGGAQRMIASVPSMKWIPFPVLKANLDAVHHGD